MELWATQDRHIIGHDDGYPLARAVIGLLGGVLEAMLLERLPGAKYKTLGGLIKQAYDKGIIRLGTNLAALSSFMLYFRNHVHADRTANRREFFIDMNTAKGCRVALNWAMRELLVEKTEPAKVGGAD